MVFSYDIVQDGKTIASYPFFQILEIIRIVFSAYEIGTPQKMLITCKELIVNFTEVIAEIEVMQKQTLPKVKEELLEQIKEANSLDQLYNVVEKLHETKCKLFTIYKYDEIYLYKDYIEKLDAFVEFLLIYQKDEYDGEFSC